MGETCHMTPDQGVMHPHISIPTVNNDRPRDPCFTGKMFSHQRHWPYGMGDDVVGRPIPQSASAHSRRSTNAQPGECWERLFREAEVSHHIDVDVLVSKVARRSRNTSESGSSCFLERSHPWERIQDAYLMSRRAQ